jgi:hypothetical protein
LSGAAKAASKTKAKIATIKTKNLGDLISILF